MTASDGIGPERLAEIVDGAPPRDDEERTLVALMEQTRALEPGASEELRRRVLDAPPPAAARRFDPRRWLGAVDGRRRLLVAGPAVAGVIALAIAIPALDGGSSSSAPAGGDPTATLTAPEAERQRLADPGAAEAAGDEAAPAPSVAPVEPKALPPGSDPGRSQQVTATTRVQVEGVTALSRTSGAAMRTVRRLGGFTASSDYSVPSGSEGTNRLVFRVPVARAEDALAAFGRLGVVTAQSASIVDLTPRIESATDRIEKLGVRIAALRARVAARPGDTARAAELARAEAVLRRAEGSRKEALSRTRLATLRLTLTTVGPPAPATNAGRFEGPISRAGGRLADATAWLLGALVLVGPFLLLAGAAAWGAARLRGRSERRLMGSA